MDFRILHYATLDSTNHLALEFARQGAQEGTVVLAEYQTKGRGRFKRRWVSPRGSGLLFSIILRPTIKTSSTSLLTHIAAQAVAEALTKSFGLPAKLKRPNDVLIAGKKIAGILSESSSYGQRLEYVIIGIGVNVNTQRKRLLKTATSIYLETKTKVSKDKVLGDILAAFRLKYTSLLKKDLSEKEKTIPNMVC
ncbi:MAG: biotin--[acetyl-CoA-carboxylase] ligase [Candidatus Omnitrophica bacterium]|nr:biotin--[acetyl-CoA-carboxylase] ligase [Candidatus Omnitrophota bacterium]